MITIMRFRKAQVVPVEPEHYLHRPNPALLMARQLLDRSRRLASDHTHVCQEEHRGTWELASKLLDRLSGFLDDLEGMISFVP